MEEHNIQLTTAEISVLWTTYLQNSATICFHKHFIQHLKDLEIKPIVEEALRLEQSYIKKLKPYLQRKGFRFQKVFLTKMLSYLLHHFIQICLL